MITWGFLSFCLAVANVHSANWAPDKPMLDAVRQIESADGRRTVGDEGRSLGDFQISEAAWADVDSWRHARGLTTFSYQRYVWDTKVARAYAADYLSILRGQLQKRLGRLPTSAEVYSAYNMGLAAFSRNQYRLSKAAVALSQVSKRNKTT